MTILPDPNAFPGAFIIPIANFLRLIDVDLKVHERPLRTTDGNQCCGVFAVDFSPDDDSYEMRGFNSPLQVGPTLQNYRINIHSLIKDGDQLRGIATHSELARRVVATVARNATLRITLGSLVHAEGGVTERPQRWAILRTRYLATEIDGSFTFLSVTELNFQTSLQGA